MPDLQNMHDKQALEVSWHAIYRVLYLGMLFACYFNKYFFKYFSKYACIMTYAPTDNALCVHRLRLKR